MNIAPEERTAATTVAATMLLAYQADIRVFATGGIGGAHRADFRNLEDFGSLWDISADLFELSRQPVAVVCAGAKSILDIPHTLEILETYSVPVIGYDTYERMKALQQPRSELPRDEKPRPPRNDRQDKPKRKRRFPYRKVEVLEADILQAEM